MPSFNYGGISLPSEVFCGTANIRALLKDGVWGGSITGYTCTQLANHAGGEEATGTFYVGENRQPVVVAAGTTIELLVENIWASGAATLCLHCNPCPCDTDMMSPMTSGAGSGKTPTQGTRWGPGGAPNDQQGAWYSGNTQYTRLGVGGVNN